MTIEQWLLDHKEEIIQEVQAVCRIDSLKTDAQPDAPFGPGIRDALHHTLALAERLGYRVTNFDNYAAHADLGEGEETMGILGHLDIVPVGEGWTYPPFGAEIHDGKIYARGSIDDKGPTVIAMYAAKAAQEVYGLGKKVRVILGCDEETTWLDMKHYLKRAQPLPDFAIVPDAEFPLINAEKGILQVRLEAHFAPSGVRMSAGERINVVPSMASADLPALPEDIAQRIAQYNTSEDGEIALEEGKLISRGVGAHGSMPHLGKNAAMHLIRFIAGAGLVGGEAGEAIAVLAEHPGLCKKGKRLGIAIEDQESGHLSMNPGVLRMSDTTLTLDIDIRHPVTYTSDEVVERIKKTLEGTPIVVNVLSAKRGLHIPKESALVQTLLDVYEEVTGTRPEPLAIGGGTYARALDNAVAFGPCFPERPGRAHEADEYIDIEDMMTAARIYALAIARLCAPEA